LRTAHPSYERQYLRVAVLMVTTRRIYQKGS